MQNIVSLVLGSDLPVLVGLALCGSAHTPMHGSHEQDPAQVHYASEREARLEESMGQCQGATPLS